MTWAVFDKNGEQVPDTEAATRNECLGLAGKIICIKRGWFSERAMLASLGYRARHIIRDRSGDDMICCCGYPLDGGHDHARCGPPIPRE